MCWVDLIHLVSIVGWKCEWLDVIQRDHWITPCACKKVRCCIYLEFLPQPSPSPGHTSSNICAHGWSVSKEDRSLSVMLLCPADVETGCNFKQPAFTLNGRTPAAKAARIRLPLTALPFFLATCMTSAPFWKNIRAALLQTLCWPHERASGFGPRQVSTDRLILMRNHLSVNPKEMFLSGKNLKSESFKTGRGTRPAGLEGRLGNLSLRWYKHLQGPKVTQTQCLSPAVLSADYTGHIIAHQSCGRQTENPLRYFMNVAQLLSSF